MAWRLAGSGGLLALLLAVTGTSSAAEPRFSASVAKLSPTLRAQMTGVSWRSGCPVPLDGLRLVELTHWGFDGRVHRGRLVVNRDVAAEIVTVFRRLHAARFPIRRMELVDRYGASDYRSIEADNTSAFNCRYVDGTSRWSEHAYGRAIDVNPIENPYVSGGATSHRASVPYLDRTPCRRGMACPRNVLVRSFKAAGWGWGGDWTSAQDYQHFSASGG
jgi:hypothetical protein